MKRDHVFPSRYLKAVDLKGEPRIVEIDHAPLEILKNSKGEDQRKIVLYFTQAKKSLPLNMTNFDSVAAICGDDTEEWSGKKIELFPTTTQMGGEIVDCVRIRRPKIKGQSPPKAKDEDEAKNEEPEDEIDDEIPF